MSHVSIFVIEKLDELVKLVSPKMCRVQKRTGTAESTATCTQQRITSMRIDLVYFGKDKSIT